MPERTRVTHLLALRKLGNPKRFSFSFGGVSPTADVTQAQYDEAWTRAEDCFNFVIETVDWGRIIGEAVRLHDQAMGGGGDDHHDLGNYVADTIDGWLCGWCVEAALKASDQ